VRAWSGFFVRESALEDLVSTLIFCSLEACLPRVVLCPWKGLEKVAVDNCLDIVGHILVPRLILTSHHHPLLE
jgi:hypothetical protein